MSNGATEFERLQESLSSGGVDGLLDGLVQELSQQNRFHDLFSAKQLQLRRQLNLPLSFSGDDDDVPENQVEKWEEGMMEICQEVGKSALEAGQIREGWMYLRPAGARDKAQELIGKIEPDDENMDEMVEVLLQEGLDVKRGFSLVLDNFGTCNAITTFESQVLQQDKNDQQIAAELLLKHVHEDLVSSVKADIAQQEDQEPAADNLAELIGEREWLFGEHSYHLDTTHLASTVRFARLLEDESLLRIAVDLTEYGKRLSSQFQYDGDEPFADLYPSHALYFQAIIGENVEEALKYFREKAESIDAYEEGTMAVEIYIELLDRLGRTQEAIDAMVKMVPDNTHLMGVAPSLMDLSKKVDEYQSWMQFCRQRNDLVGFAAGLCMSAKS